MALSPRRFLHLARFEELGYLLLQVGPFMTNRRVGSMEVLSQLFQGRHLFMRLECFSWALGSASGFKFRCSERFRSLIRLNE